MVLHHLIPLTKAPDWEGGVTLDPEDDLLNELNDVR